jgi:hypothetical protein
MSRRIFHCLVLWSLIMGGMEGCTVLQSGSSTTLPSSAFFPIDPAELKPLQAIGQAQDIRMKDCHKGTVCEEAFYTRGLVALFENRADAITVFQQLHIAMPNSRYDAATIGWLNLLQDTSSHSVHSRALFVQLKQEVLHKLLERSEVADWRIQEEHERRVAELNQ